MKRRRARKVKIGNVEIGGDAPVSIQSMTKTDTKAVDSTLNEIRKLKRAGCEIVRVAVKDDDALEAFKRIVSRSEMPIVADIHFNPKLALGSIDAGASAIRLNPGNIKSRQDIEVIIRRAKDRRIPIRIGVNSGSLSVKNGTVAESMAKGVSDYIKIFEKSGFQDIIISLKSSDVSETIEAYRKMAGSCDYPFHLGITAAGPYLSAAVKSSIGIGTLLQEGIGDTIRVSMTGDPLAEVEIAKEILSSLKLRSFGPEIISCPTCGRCEIDLAEIVEGVRERLKEMKKVSLPLKVAIMGCVVNGPGEAQEADIGIAGGKDSAALFKKGKKIKNLKQEEVIDVLIAEIKAF
ncbi:MAG: flavodoxin-dependent (E)-4-hydroxy-3-methylbut-2-enyl-diphosphate synthase [Candidatus Omnitrophica bacterium]|nr:flavodoxin-dependent (E)-4-hydroxy-3-methylbut-2-enyl-diphosphate synthase [Candidatus Omnitrophota bacterium]